MLETISKEKTEKEQFFFFYAIVTHFLKDMNVKWRGEMDEYGGWFHWISIKEKGWFKKEKITLDIYSGKVRIISYDDVFSGKARSLARRIEAMGEHVFLEHH